MMGFGNELFGALPMDGATGSTTDLASSSVSDPSLVVPIAAPEMRMCCRAMTLTCLACAADMTAEAFCASDKESSQMVCPKPAAVDRAVVVDKSKTATGGMFTALASCPF
jgi:hypothetical protein